MVEVGELGRVPRHDLVRVERQRTDGLVLRLAPLVAAHEHVHEEALAEALALVRVRLRLRVKGRVRVSGQGQGQG